MNFQVTLPEGQMKIDAGQQLGVYFPSNSKMAVRIKAVNPKYPLFGSEYIPNHKVLSVGENLTFGRIGYPNRLAIEFYIRSGKLHCCYLALCIKDFSFRQLREK